MHESLRRFWLRIRMVLGDNASFVSDEEWQAIPEDEQLEAIPADPEAGYVAYIGDVLVVRLN